VWYKGGQRGGGEMERGVGLEVLHIAAGTAKAVRAGGYRRIALLGTAVTLEAPFVKGRLQDCWDLDVVVPGPETRRRLDRMITADMAQGTFSPEARLFVLQTIDRMHRSHRVQATVLGCTELPILLGDS